MNRHWEQCPPVHVSTNWIARYLGYKPRASSGQPQASKDDTGEIMDFLLDGSEKPKA